MAVHIPQRLPVVAHRSFTSWLQEGRHHGKPAGAPAIFNAVPHMEVSMAMGVPQHGWFLFGENPVKLDDEQGYHPHLFWNSQLPTINLSQLVVTAKGEKHLWPQGGQPCSLHVRYPPFLMINSMRCLGKPQLFWWLNYPTLCQTSLMFTMIKSPASCGWEQPFRMFNPQGGAP